MEMLEDRLPEDFTSFDVTPPNRRSIVDGISENRIFIYIQGAVSRDKNSDPKIPSKISFEDSGNIISLLSKGYERFVTLEIDQRTPLSEEKRQEYVDLVLAYFNPSD